VTAWWQARPRWLRWSMWTGVIATVVTIANLARALDALDPILPATRGYVAHAVKPLLVLGLENRIALIEARQETIRTRLDMAEARLRLDPGDAVVKAARDALQRELDRGEVMKAEANCDLRAVRGLTCAR
jgi:hypothetical protein